MSETTEADAKNTPAAPAALNNGIAIIGLEGSGKTVFLAALAQAMQEHDGYPYLEPSDDDDIVKTRMYIAELWNDIQRGKWPPSTNVGTLRILSWTWHSSERLSHTVWLPDCAGQDIRRIFEDGAKDEHQKQLSREIFASRHVWVLFNLKELIDLHGVEAKNDKRVLIETAVCTAIKKLHKSGREFSVLLTQYDAYQTLIEEKFGGDFTKAIKFFSVSLWRVVNQCRPELMPVSAVETEDRLENKIAGRFPVRNAKPAPSVFKVVRALNDRILEGQRKKVVFWRSMVAAFAVTVTAVIAGILLFRASWVPGMPHPQWAHIIADVPEGVWMPAPGCVLNDAHDLSQGAVWKPGMRHPSLGHMSAADKEGAWIPDPGYDWVDPSNQKKGVGWRPAQAHPSDSRVTAAQTEGSWEVPLGYSLEGDRAVWKPGRAHPGDSRVTAAQAEGQWEVPLGYSLEGDRAVWEPGRAHPSDPRVTAAQAEGKWEVPLGYSLEGGRAVWKSGRAHPNDPHVIAAQTEGQWDVQPGYRLEGDRAVWFPGRAHPNDSRVTAAQAEGKWDVPLGYRLEGGRAVWNQGQKHPNDSRVTAAWTEGKWDVPPGYRLSGDRAIWVYGQSHPNDSRVTTTRTEGKWEVPTGYSLEGERAVWRPGMRHPSLAHVLTGQKEGHWMVAPGYAWVDRDDISRGARWKPGLTHPDNAHVTAARTEGRWEVPPGYRLEGERAVWEPGQMNPNDSRVIASRTEGKWEVPPGYRLEGERAVWRSGTRHPSMAHVATAERERHWIPDTGYDWVDSSDIDKGVRWKIHTTVSTNRRTGIREGTFEDWKNCTRCNGRGTVSESKTTYCLGCNGTGRLTCLYYAANNGACTQLCRACGGTRQVWNFGYVFPCRPCLGTGFVRCSNCAGNGWVGCAPCMGTGGRKTQNVTEECPVCDGDKGSWR